jgi:hypothetical protein
MRVGCLGLGCRLMEGIVVYEMLSERGRDNDRRNETFDD